MSYANFFVLLHALIVSDKQTDRITFFTLIYNIGIDMLGIDKYTIYIL